MSLKAYLPLMIRAGSFITVLALLYMFGSINSIFICSILITSTFVTLLKIKGAGSAVSYLLSVVIILGLTYFFMSLYGIYHNITFIGYYSVFILFFGTITDIELLYTIRHGRSRLIYVLLALKIYGVIIERYYRSLEMNKALLGRQRTVFLKGIISTLQSLPYLTFRIAEYLHTHLPYVMGQEANLEK